MACLVVMKFAACKALLRQLPRRADGRRITVALLTGSVKGKQRRQVLSELDSGELSLVRAPLLLNIQPAVLRNHETSQGLVCEALSPL